MDIAQAKKIAAKLLSYKPYTCKEVYGRLIKKGCEADVAEEAVAEFCRAGVLNDEEYAKMYIHDAMLIGMKGIFRIRRELCEKGIAASVIERAAAAVEVDPLEQLEGYVELRFADREFSDWRELEKAKAHLVRRGYGISDINRCFKKLGIEVSKAE